MNLEMELKGTNVALKTVGRQCKDRFTSMEYGVWWCQKYLEPKNKIESSDSDWLEMVKQMNGSGMSNRRNLANNFFR